MSPKDLARTFDIRNFTTAQNSGHKNISFPIIPAVEFTQQHRYPSQHNGGKEAVGLFAGLADGPGLCSSVRVERAGGEMPCYDNLGSIPNQSSRSDAGFGINIKPINSNDGVDSGGRPLSSSRNTVIY